MPASTSKRKRPEAMALEDEPRGRPSSRKKSHRRPTRCLGGPLPARASLRVSSVEERLHAVAFHRASHSAQP